MRIEMTRGEVDNTVARLVWLQEDKVHLIINGANLGRIEETMEWVEWLISQAIIVPEVD